MAFLNDEQFFKKFNLTPESILEFASPNNFLCYYTGSLNEGRGSATSDVDVVIIADEKEIERRVKERNYRLRNAGRTAFMIDELNEAPIEVAIFLRSDILEIVERLDSIDFCDPNVFVNTKPLSSHLAADTVLSILHRIFIAKPLNQPEKFIELQHRISRSRLCLWQARSRVARLNHLYEDLSGRLEIGEPESAFFLAREALMSLAAIYTNFLGVSFDRTKWWKLAFDKVSHHIPDTRDRILRSLYCDCSSKSSRIAILEECLNLIDEFHVQETTLEKALLGDISC